MPSGFELTQEHYRALDANAAAIKSMEGYGRSKAEKEAAYNAALAKRIAELRADGVAAGICEKLAKGDRAVSMAYVDWQMDETLYAASKEHIQLAKRRADAIRDQMQREWTAAGGRA